MQCVSFVQRVNFGMTLSIVLFLYVFQVGIKWKLCQLQKIRQRFPFRDHVCLLASQTDSVLVSDPDPDPDLIATYNSAANLLIMQFNALTAHKLQHQQKKRKKSGTKQTTTITIRRRSRHSSSYFKFSHMV